MLDLATIAANLELTPDGIWRCKCASPISYPDWGNDACFQVEDLSFWFRHRNACILEALKQFPPPGPVFDVGGGNGFVAKGMQDLDFEVVLVEPGPTGCANAKARGIRYVVCAGLGGAGFSPSSMPAVGLFDVVEHIEQDQAFLGLINSYLPPGGRLYLTVPAYRALWSHEDVDARHFRRYSRHELHQLLRESGLEIEMLTGFFQFLPPAIFLGRVIPFRLGLAKSGNHDNNRKMRAQHELRSSIVSRSLAWLQERELNQIRARRVVRFGGSWLAVARKV